MAKYLLVAPSNAMEGQDAEYCEWYDTTHLADICALPGVISGRRFEVSPASPNAPPGRYFAVYEIETEDPDAVLAAMYRRSRAGEMQISPALDLSSTQLWLFKQA